MHVRSYEIVDADIRALHDFLRQAGGFQFRAGGAGFFVLVGERFSAASAATQAQMVVAQTEAGTVSIDVIGAGGETGSTSGAAKTEWSFGHRAKGLLDGFAERHGLVVVDL